jgi:hypothetical protein
VDVGRERPAKPSHSESSHIRGSIPPSVVLTAQP